MPYVHSMTFYVEFQFQKKRQILVFFSQNDDEQNIFTIGLYLMFLMIGLFKTKQLKPMY
mgnify:CR=1 FL=1